MSIAVKTPPAPVPQAVVPPTRRCGINLADEAFIPDWICDLASFRRWADSEEYPTHGRYAFLQGQLWVDLTMEQLFTHNQLKTKLTSTLSHFADEANLGYVFSDGVRLSHPGVELSAEPDAVFVTFDAIRTGGVKLIRGQLGGYVELEGSPEIVVEIVSASSVRKDTEVLRELYAHAGVAEYWLFDARSPTPTFELLALAEAGYQPASTSAAGAFSNVLHQHVQLTHDLDPLGNPRFGLRLTATTTSPT